MYIIISVLSWLAAVVSLNETRAGPKYELKKGNPGTCSDGNPQRESIHVSC